MKKWMTLMMVAVLTIGLFAGCGEKPAEDKKDKAQVDQKEDKKGDNKDEGVEVPTLKWVTVGSGMPENYDSWQKQVNTYIEPLIGAKVDMEVVSWGDWDTRRNVIVTSSEPFDLIFGNGGTFNKDVTVGALADITELVKKSDKLQSLIPSDYWKAAEIKGKIYAVPTYKDSSITEYFVWDKPLLEKYEITDYEKINSLQAAEPVLKKITEGEGRPAYTLEKRGVYQVLDTYDSFSLGLPFVGVKYNDQDFKVVNVLEQEDVKAELKAIHKMYEEGVINSDAFTKTEVQPSGVIFSVAQGWPMAAETVWGVQRGSEAVVSRFTPTMLTNASVLGSINSVSVNSKYPDKAIALLELINTDSKLRDLFYYGEEGVDFEYKDGKINRLKTDWKMAGYTQGTFFNVTPEVGIEKNQWDEVRQLNEQAEPSVLLGFQIDTTNIQAEIANVNQIWMTDSPELLTGVKEPEEAIENMVAKMKTAGLDKIIEECQSQIEAFKTSK